MARKEFPVKVRVAVIKRATIGAAVFCESCGALAKKFQIDHINPDGLTGQPIIENAMLICEPCFLEKNAKDASTIALAKRQEAKHLGAESPKAKIPAPPKAPRVSKAPVIRQFQLYLDI